MDFDYLLYLLKRLLSFKSCYKNNQFVDVPAKSIPGIKQFHLHIIPRLILYDGHIHLQLSRKQNEVNPNMSDFLDPIWAVKRLYPFRKGTMAQISTN